MTLPPGFRLGPYELLAPIGVGGMGEVYRAKDSRLDRDVAVKVLPARFATDDDMRLRFEREARTISQLSSPAVCAIFDVGSHEGVSYLVMELLEGQSLAQRLAKGPLPVPQALRVARDVCQALEAAHRKGIVHRDVKPANIFLSATGTKLLDFGLARLRERIEAGEVSIAPTQGPPLTDAGVVLGTIGYMAPEQVEGKPADARSDIFALGAVLFEMVSGSSAFAGDSPKSVLSAILASEPPPLSSPKGAVSPALERVVRTCLAKEPEERWQSASDLGRELSWIESEVSGSRRDVGSAAVSLPRVPSATSRWIPWLVAAVAAVVAMGALLRPRQMPVQLPHVVRFLVPPPPNGTFPFSVEMIAIAVSPDGSRVAFVAISPPESSSAAEGETAAAGVRRIWVRALSETEPRPLAGTDGANSLFFSPDGRSIGFFTPNKLKRVDLDGGTPVPVCDLPVGAGRAGTWGAGGDILISNVQGMGLSRIASAGGDPVPVVKADSGRGEIRVSWPWFLPDGKRFLYFVRLRDKSGRIMLYEPGETPRPILTASSTVQFVEPGFLVFAREGVLLAQRFDWRTGRLEGDPFPVAERVTYFESSAFAAFAASPAGTVAYRTSETVSRLVWFDRAGRKLGTIGPPGDYLSLSMTRDGRRVYYDRREPGLGTLDVWSYDLESGVETRVTSTPDTEISPLELEGGKGVAFAATREGQPRLYRMDLVSGHEEPLAPVPAAFQVCQDLSPDGSTLVYVERTPETPFDIWTVPVRGPGKPTPVLRSSFEKEEVRFSPDGRFLSFESDESGRSEVYVMPYPGPGARRRVSRDGALVPRWSRDGRELLYLSADRHVVSVPVQTSPALSLGAPRELFGLSGRHPWSGFVVTPDGKRFLAIEPEAVAGEQPLTVITNWIPGAGR